MAKTPKRRLDVAALRRRYPVLKRRIDGKRLVYLDSACTALKPRIVAETLRDFYGGLGGCGGKRSTHRLSQEVEDRVRSARGDIADFIGAERPEDVVFTSGTTEAVGIVARGLPRARGRDEIVLTDAEHNSVVLPFLETARRGRFRLRFCPAKRGRPDFRALERLISRRTALVAMTRSSNVLGGEFPTAGIVRAAHAKGALVLVDDAQYLSSHREDVRSSDVDFAAFSAHKLGGPFGIGALYGKEHLLNRLRGARVGGGTVRDIERKRGAVSADYLDAPAGLEAGIQNLGGAVAFAAAVRLLRELPAAAVREHIAGLVRRTARGAARIRQVRLLADPEFLSRGSIVSLRPAHPSFSSADFNMFLNHELKGACVAVRVGEHCAHILHKRIGAPATVRVSFFAYNTAEEVDIFLGALRAYVREACR